MCAIAQHVGSNGMRMHLLRRGFGMQISHPKSPYGVCVGECICIFTPNSKCPAHTEHSAQVPTHRDEEMVTKRHIYVSRCMMLSNFESKHYGANLQTRATLNEQGIGTTGVENRELPA